MEQKRPQSSSIVSLAIYNGKIKNRNSTNEIQEDSRYIYKYNFRILERKPGWLHRETVSDEIMEDNRAEQIEALQVLEEFNGRLVKNMEIIVKELSGERLDDTDQFLKGIIDAINWEIQVVNSTMQVLNDGKVRVDKESFNADIVALSEAISAKDDAKMAEEFQRVIPVFKQLGESVNEVIK